MDDWDYKSCQTFQLLVISTIELLLTYIWKSSCDLTLFVSVFSDSAMSCENIPDIAKSGLFEHLPVSYVLERV